MLIEAMFGFCVIGSAIAMLLFIYLIASAVGMELVLLLSFLLGIIIYLPLSRKKGVMYR